MKKVRQPVSQPAGWLFGWCFLAEIWGGRERKKQKLKSKSSRVRTISSAPSGPRIHAHSAWFLGLLLGPQKEAQKTTLSHVLWPAYITFCAFLLNKKKGQMQKTQTSAHSRCQKSGVLEQHILQILYALSRFRRALWATQRPTGRPTQSALSDSLPPSRPEGSYGVSPR